MLTALAPLLPTPPLFPRLKAGPAVALGSASVPDGASDSGPVPDSASAFDPASASAPDSALPVFGIDMLQAVTAGAHLTSRLWLPCYFACHHASAWAEFEALADPQSTADAEPRSEHCVWLGYAGCPALP